MTPLALTPEELHNIETGAWFSKLSRPLRDDILSRAVVRRLKDGAMLSTRGSAAEEWCGVALGAVRISSVSLSGRQVTLTYAEPGVWFGDIALFDGLPRTHDADAHGPTTLLAVRKPDFKDLLARHVELYDALLRLNCRRLRLMFNQFEDLNTRPLRDEFPRIEQLTFQLTFTDASRLSSYSAQLRTFAPAANAFFEIPCPSTVCIGGGFDLASVVWSLSSRAASETSGIVVCQGHTGTDERGPRACALQLQYHVTVTYLGSPQLVDPEQRPSGHCMSKMRDDK